MGRLDLDPELLAELAAITGAPPPRAKPSEIPRPAPAHDPVALKDRIAKKKREALMLKKSGDAQAAVAAIPVSLVTTSMGEASRQRSEKEEGEDDEDDSPSAAEQGDSSKTLSRC